MIKQRFSFIAESIIREVDTDMLTAVRIIEDRTLESFPFFTPSFSILFSISRETSDPSSIDCVLSIKNNSKQITSKPIRMDFKDTLLCRTVILVGGLVVPDPGTLAVELVRDGQLIASYYVTLLLKNTNVIVS